MIWIIFRGSWAIASRLVDKYLRRKLKNVLFATRFERLITGVIAGLVLTALAHVLDGRLKGRIDERRSSIKRPNSDRESFCN